MADPEHRFINDRRSLEALAGRLGQRPDAVAPGGDQQRRRLYLDTEFDSSRDGTRLCLVQIGTGDEIALVDAMALRGEPLAGALGAAEWVLHGAQQDIPLLTAWLGLKQAPALFDTQVAWALLGPEPSVSLAYALYRALGVRTRKGYQADDWLRRPLPPAQLSYAAEDVVHLPALHAALHARLVGRGRAELVHAVCQELLSPVPTVPEPLSLDSFRNAWQLAADQQAALRFLVSWWNADVEHRREGPEPKTLLAMASRIPETRDDLVRIKGVPRRWGAAFGAELSLGMVRATVDARADDFVPIEPAPYATFAELRARAFVEVLRVRAAERLEVAPDLLLPGRLCERLRGRVASGDGADGALGALEGWRARLLGPVWSECWGDGPGAPPAAPGC